MLKTEDNSLDGVELERTDGNELLCIVCKDVATGRHYGTIACNGCKGFFRRTIRRAYKYTCRFDGNCNIDKHNRAVCRSCRFMRCINAGMKIDAVQNERDIIGKRHRTGSTSSSLMSPTTASGCGIAVSATKTNSRRSSFSSHNVPTAQSSLPSTSSSSSSPTSNWDTPKSLLESLLASEKSVQSLRDTVIKQTSGVRYAKLEPTVQISEGVRKATANDIFLSLHSQLLLVIEWAKTLPPFTVLSTDDQTVLLKSFACQHVVLCVTYRSRNNSGVLKLINDSCIPRLQDENNPMFHHRYYVRDCEKMMDQLVAPMRFLKMDDVEFVAMKACILFNPVAKGLSNGSVMHVLSTRRKIFAALEHYISTKIPGDANRIGDLTFFILSPLQSLANMISEDILVSKLSGVAQIDQLMEELILADTEEQKLLPNRFQAGQSLKEAIGVSSIPESMPSTSSYSQCENQGAHGNSSSPSSPVATLAEFDDSQTLGPFNGFSPSTTLSSYVLGPLNSSEPSSPLLDLLGPSGSSPPNEQNGWSNGTQSNFVNNDSGFVSSSLNF